MREHVRTKLVLGDCLELIDQVGHADAVITDPPYGINYRNKRADITGRHYAPAINGDCDCDVGQQMIDACFARGWPVCAFAHIRRPWAGDWRQFLVWDKGGAVGGGGDRKTCWKQTAELIQVGGFGELNGPRDSSVLRFPIGPASMHLHPTQKPLKLMEYLILKLTKPGDVILDPFAGSGTTVEAAMNTGRRCIAFETDPNYFRIARRRCLNLTRL